MRGSVRNRCRGPGGWLETEGSEGQTRESGRPVGERTGVHAARKWVPKNRANRSQSAHSSEEVP